MGLDRKEALLVDASPLTRLFVQRILLEEGYDVRHASDGLEALAVLEEKGAELLVVDQDMPHLSGADFLSQRATRLLSPGADVIFCTANRLIATPSNAYRLSKPIVARELLLLLRVITARRDHGPSAARP